MDGEPKSRPCSPEEPWITSEVATSTSSAPESSEEDSATWVDRRPYGGSLVEYVDPMASDWSDGVSGRLHRVASLALDSSYSATLNIPYSTDSYYGDLPARSVTTQPQPTRVDAPSASWLTQFHADRVKSLLLSAPGGDQIDEALAIAAGERVQAQALARVARRRIRVFLKERDQAWWSGQTSTTPRTSPASLFDRQRNDVSIDQEMLIDQETPGVHNCQHVVELMLEYGLSTKDVAEIFVHTPGIALMRPRSRPGDQGESLQMTLDRVLTELLSNTLKLRKYDARKVLRQCPGLLTKRGSKSAEQTVVLLSRLGVSANSLSRDKNALSTLLLRSPAELFRLVSFLSSDAVRMPLSKIGPLLRRPECLSLLNAVAPARRIGNREGNDDDDDDDENDSNLDTTDVNEMVLSVLTDRSMQSHRERVNEIYRRMTKTAWALRNEIGTEDLGKVIAAYPSVLLLDATRQILPAAQYLMEELGIWKDDLPRVLQLYPALLGMELDQMRRVAAYMTLLGVAQENLSNIFRSFPALLTLDVEQTMRPVVAFLESMGLANIGRFVTRLPPVLGYSVENELKPKWKFLCQISADARFDVSKFPAYFSYPLDRVIKTRYEYLSEVKRLPTQILAVDQVLRYGDRDFAVKVAGDTDGGRTFVDYAQARQKLDQGRTPSKNKQQHRKPHQQEGRKSSKA